MYEIYANATIQNYLKIMMNMLCLKNFTNYLSREAHNSLEMFFYSCKSYRESIAIA